MLKPKTSFLLSLLATMSLLVLPASAQDRGSDRGSRDFDPAAMVSRMDANQNGVLEPAEMEGRSGRYLERLGVDISKSIRVNDVLKIVGARTSNSDKDKTAATGSAASVNANLKVPSFSSVAVPVPTFGSAESEVSYESFSESVRRRAEQTLYRLDRNRDGFLDAEEMKDGDWNPSPNVSDTNQDGRLSKIELAFRYQSKEEFEQKFERRDRRDWRDRDENESESRSSDSSSKNTSRSPDRGQFGSSSESSFARSDSSRSSSSPSSPTASNAREDVIKKYRTFAEGTIKKYDTDGDGKLSKEEIKAMTRPPASDVDTDGDGFITVDELLAAILPKQDAKPTSSDAKASSSSSRTDSARTSTVRRSDFGGLDANSNNQIEMHEFADEWSEEKLAEFYAKDKNGDGVITLEEWNAN